MALTRFFQSRTQYIYISYIYIDHQCATNDEIYMVKCSIGGGNSIECMYHIALLTLGNYLVYSPTCTCIYLIILTSVKTEFCGKKGEKIFSLSHLNKCPNSSVVSVVTTVGYNKDPSCRWEREIRPEDHRLTS